MLAILGASAPIFIQKALLAKGYEIILLPPHSELPEALSAHADLLLFFAPDAILTPANYQSIAKKELEIISNTSGRPILPIDISLGKDYPRDVPLNAAVIGKTLLYNPKTAARELQALPYGKFCHVRQGYTKCAVLPVDHDALITADHGIATAAAEIGMDCLEISPGEVTLPGYDMGLIGGAASYAPYKDYDKILFCGDPSLHQQGEAILQFCDRHKKQCVALTPRPLFDVGTVFLI